MRLVCLGANKRAFGESAHDTHARARASQENTHKKVQRGGRAWPGLALLGERSGRESVDGEREGREGKVQI